MIFVLAYKDFIHIFFYCELFLISLKRLVSQSGLQCTFPPTAGPDVGGASVAGWGCSEGGQSCGLRGRRHCGVHSGSLAQLLLHGDEHKAAGGASCVRDDHQHWPGGVAAQGGCLGPPLLFSPYEVLQNWIWLIEMCVFLKLQLYVFACLYFSIQ